MTQADRTLEALRQTPQRLCDDCLTLLVGLSQRQITYAACEGLAGRGLIARGVTPCDSCGRIKKSSWYPVTVVQMVDIADLSGARARADRPWHWERSVRSALVTWLATHGYSIRSVADTAARSAGKDIIAITPEAKELWISVKGYPEASPSTPAPTQARHWFSSAAFDLLLYHGENPDVALALALPDGFTTYTSLAARVAWFRKSLPFALFWVSETGDVRVEHG